MSDQLNRIFKWIDSDSFTYISVYLSDKTKDIVERIHLLINIYKVFLFGFLL